VVDHAAGTAGPRVIGDNGRRTAHTGGLVPDEATELMQTLHREHAADLWRYCLRLTMGDATRAQDLCQDTLLRAWQHPEVLSRSTAQTRAWLFTVAKNLAIDDWRSRRSRPETVTADLPERGEQQDRIDQLLETWIMAEAMTRLSVEHRQVLHECYFRGRTVAEAARRLGVPEGTVKSRSHYALRALRLALEEQGVTR
jgi:RNA polymerase sigma-70 factor, ECF subfamily